MEGVERLVASEEIPALPLPEEPPLRLSDEEVAEAGPAGITGIDLAAIEAELAAA